MALTPGFRAVAELLQEAAMQMTHSDLHRRVSKALSEKHPNNSVSLVDVSGDENGGHAIYSKGYYGGDLKKAAFTGAKVKGVHSITVDTENASDVMPRTSYEGVPDMKAQESLRGYRANLVAEAGARNSKADASTIQSIHDNAVDLGATCDDASETTEEARRVSRGTGGLTLVESAEPLETIRLQEAKSDYEIKLIAPGKGSSAFYPAEVLKRDGPAVFRAGTRVFLNHSTLAEEAARPEGDVRNLAGVTSTDAVYHESHAKGPGLYARMRVFADHAAMVEEKAAHVGMSIRAGGIKEAGKMQDGVPVLKSFTHAESVDIVTQAGAGGMILTESQRIAAEEQSDMTVQEQTQLREASATNARLLKRAIRGDARELAAEVLKDFTLQEAAKRRVIETCLQNVPEKDGDLDSVAFTEAVKAEAKREGAYVSSISGAGRVLGMGGAPGGVQLTEAQLAESELRRKREDAEGVALFESMGMPKEAAAAAAKGRAA